MSRSMIILGWMVGVALLGHGTAHAEVLRLAKTVESPRLVVQAGHSNAIGSVAFSPDGKTIVTGSGDDTLKLWDVASGRLLRIFTGHSKRVSSVAFSPSGKMLVSASFDKTLRLWDIVSGQVLRTCSGHSGFVTSVNFSPDGKMIVSGSKDETVKLWDVASCRLLRVFTGHSDIIRSVAFSPDGKMVVSGGDGQKPLKLWNVANGRELQSFAGHSSGVVTVAFSPDGKKVMSGCWDDTLKLWDVVSGIELKTFAGHSGDVGSVAFSPNGKTVVSGSEDKTLKLWDVVSGRELRTFLGHSNGVVTVAFSPDGKTVVSGGEDNTLKLWDVISGRELRTFSGYSDFVRSFAFSPDGLTVVSGSRDKTLKLWDLVSGRMLRTFSGHSDIVTSVDFSPDGKTVVSGSSDKTLKLWEMASGRELRTISGHSDIVTSVDFSPDGKRVVSGSFDRTRKLWDSSSGRELRTFAGTSIGVTTVAFSPDGKMLVSGSFDNTIKRWDIASGQELRTFSGHSNVITSVAFSTDGKTVVSGSWDKTLKLWDASSGRELRAFSGHSDVITSVAFAPDGKTVISGSRDKTLKLWDASSGQELRTFSRYLGWVGSVAFSPDGKTVMSGDDNLKLWHVSDGSLLATLISFSDGRWAVTDPEGRFDVADLEDMPHLHWVMPDDPLTPLPLEIFMRDRYEPRLLARILNGEKFKPVRALGELNRVQPEVKITGIEPDSEPGYVKVSVEAKGVSRAYGFSDRKIATAAHDLRLFRNGQLVGYAEGKLAEAGRKPFQRTFRVRLPSGQAPLNFTAYAFNDDRVKSATAQQSYTPPTAIAIGKPRAYLITVGVNRHDNPAWNLRYAANDARQISQSLAPLLKNQKSYEEVVTIPLISDTDGPNLATKANIKAVLDVLSGRKADVSAIPGGDKLRLVTPDDLVLISFSGHGFGEGGLFYLIPSDNGTGSDREISPALTAHAISSDELSAWLRDVDAGNMAMIVDACHSAASVGDEFKPGPMGSRGLGQLAFDKGMRILAASQADDVALESDLIQQGLLSFALVENGLEGKQADFKPKDKKITLEEWLSYGVNRVPSLAEEVKAGTVVASRGGVRTFSGELKKKRAIQQPALFDFTKGRRDAVLEAGEAK